MEALLQICKRWLSVFITVAIIVSAVCSVQAGVATPSPITLSVETNTGTTYATAVEFKQLITSEPINMFRGSVRLRGERPVVTLPNTLTTANPNLSAEFIENLNEHLYNQFNEFIQLASGVTRSLSFHFEVIVSGQFINILFFCYRNAAALEQHIKTTVINSETMQIVSLTSILGCNAIRLINQSLSPLIASEPALYIASFAGISNKQYFYVNDNYVVLVFSEFELMRTRAGITRLSLNKNDVINVIIPAEEVRFLANITMLPLRMVITDFGYYPFWTAATRSINIVSQQVSLSVSINETRVYDAVQPGQVLFLETAPAIFNNRTYMPLSFFNYFLGLTHYVGEGGSITFSRFTGSLISSN